MKLIFIRHGETPWNTEHRVQGRTDIPLNARGEAQAVSVAEAVARFSPDRIYSSPLKRARRTAELVAKRCGIEKITDMDELVEIRFGLWEGKNAAEIEAEFPDVWRDWSWLHRPADCARLEAESADEILGRTLRAVERIISEGDGTAVIVTHTMPIKLFFSYAMHMPAENTRRLRLDNCSMSEVDLSDGGWTLVKWNETGHLASGERI